MMSWQSELSFMDHRKVAPTQDEFYELVKRSQNGEKLQSIFAENNCVTDQ
jgi:hypothetical protein